MKKIFEKYETLFCILLIVLYVVSNSICLNVFHDKHIASVMINTILTCGLLGLIILLDRVKYYGLIKVVDLKKYLYFIPLLLIITSGAWNGIQIKNNLTEIIFYSLNMLNIGFIEEIIFRGFLFKMMEKDNQKVAIIVSSLTFGVGHIINLMLGADLMMTMMQIVYASIIGYLFVTIFIKSGSLIPCILAHGINNALTIFFVDTPNIFISMFFLGVIPLLYTYYLMKRCS